MSMMCGYFPCTRLDKIKFSLLLWSRHSPCERFIHERYGISAGTQIINNSLTFIVSLWSWVCLLTKRSLPCNQLNDVALLNI